MVAPLSRGRGDGRRGRSAASARASAAPGRRRGRPRGFGVSGTTGAEAVCGAGSGPPQHLVSGAVGRGFGVSGTTGAEAVCGAPAPGIHASPGQRRGRPRAPTGRWALLTLSLVWMSTCDLALRCTGEEPALGWARKTARSRHGRCRVRRVAFEPKVFMASPPLDQHHQPAHPGQPERREPHGSWSSGMSTVRALDPQQPVASAVTERTPGAAGARPRGHPGEVLRSAARNARSPPPAGPSLPPSRR